MCRSHECLCVYIQVIKQVYLSPATEGVSICVRLQLHLWTGVQFVAWLRLCPFVGEVVRNDSMHSDSSGYADEEVSPSHRWKKGQSSMLSRLWSFSCRKLRVSSTFGKRTVKQAQKIKMSWYWKRLGHMWNIQRIPALKKLFSPPIRKSFFPVLILKTEYCQ